MPLTTLDALVTAALELGAESVPGWSEAESDLVAATIRQRVDIGPVKKAIKAGADPLGDAFCALRNAEARRPLGQTYTPQPIVDSMINWAGAQATPVRCVDPGVGSARYLLAAGRRFKKAELIGTDVDPLAALMARANLATAGMASRARIELTDYRELVLPDVEGKTCFISNPPYVRHHLIEPHWKRWLVTAARERGLAASQLAGLHVYFFLATAALGKPGDFGTFITSSEWLDVNYGRLVRELLLDGLGGTAIHVLDAKAAPFADATTTGVITNFALGAKPTSLTMRQVKSVDKLGALDKGRKVSRARLAEAPRWTPLLRVTPKLPPDYVELGELCRVHRGTVTGANSVWVTRRGSVELPEKFLFPTVTKARELFAAGDALRDPATLRVVVDLPTDLDVLDAADRKMVDAFLKRPQVAAAKHGYVAGNRKAWWSVGLRAPAPLLATYMARRPPAFVENPASAHHINIAHGIYPRERLSDTQMSALAAHLRVSVSLGQGRTYAGGLTKFEPREMERLPVPHPDLLAATS